ncbi:MAG TPA: hypothetical protein VJ866_00620 [Pyrinomonadaceae bacterium]|nr:hypothetical protein [Pyrinomonadaceae bacterium]
MKRTLILITLLSLTVALQSAAAQDEARPLRVSLIEFYGYGGLDVSRVRAALPVREGEVLPSRQALQDMRGRIAEAARRAARRPAAEVSFVSPGRNEVFVFVGLSGKSAEGFTYNAAPKGDARLSDAAMEVHGKVETAFSRALQRGATGEDDSKGYNLSSNDAELRAAQLAMHEYAAPHEDEIRRVLRESADVAQRQIASEMLGYADQSAGQIADLVWASHDPDDGVRNNATRALLVLARSDPKVAARIPADGFIDMLNSGTWTDRNKASSLLDALSRWREPRLLAALRASALQSLVEMARWRSGHGFPARMLLGRMAGIEETRLAKLASTNDGAEVIIKAARRKR